MMGSAALGLESFGVSALRVFGYTILMTWREFLQHNFDKLLLIFLVHAIVTLMLTTLSGNPTITAWLQNEASTAMGALIMLITGRATKPEPTVTAQTTTTQSVAMPESTAMSRQP